MNKFQRAGAGIYGAIENTLDDLRHIWERLWFDRKVTGEVNMFTHAPDQAGQGVEVSPQTPNNAVTFDRLYGHEAQKQHVSYEQDHQQQRGEAMSLVQAPAITDKQTSDDLPPDIFKYEVKLRKARIDIEKIARLSDGLVFGVVGLDGIVGLVPYVGEAYTAGASFYLFVLARRVRATLGSTLLILCLSAVDVVLGVWPIAGDFADMLLRVHAWLAKHLIEHVDMKLSLIERARAQVAQKQRADLTALRDVLFRGGRTVKQQKTVYAVIIGSIVILYGSCAIHNIISERIRAQKIQECKNSGGWGWLCELRN